MTEPQFIIEEITDPAEIARHRVGAEQAMRNSDWLQAHWADVLPQARGKFLAVTRRGTDTILPHGVMPARSAAHPCCAPPTPLG